MSIVVLRMYQGDDREWAMTLTGDGDPIDLTDCDLTFTAAKTKGGTAVIELTSTDNEITVVTPAAGTILLNMAAADTSGLTIPTTYAWPWYRPWTYVTRKDPMLKLYWDIQVTDAAGLKRTWPEDTDGRPRLGVLYIYPENSA